MSDNIQVGNILKSCCERQDGAEERIIGIERLRSEFESKHGSVLSELLGKLDQMFERLATCEEHMGNQDGGGPVGEIHRAYSSLRSTQNILASDNASLEARHTSLSDKVHKLDASLTELFAKDFHDGRGIVELEQSLFELVQQSKTQNAVGDRLQGIEKGLEKAQREFERKLGCLLTEALADVDRLRGRLAACEARECALNDLKATNATIANGSAVLEIRLTSLKERVDIVESRLDTNGERRQEKEVEALKAVTTSSVELKRLTSQHSSLSDRLDYMETLLGDATDRLSEKVSVVQTELEHVCARLDEKDKAFFDLEGDQARLETHVSGLERAVLELLVKQGKEMAALADAHANLASETKALNWVGDSRRETRLSVLERVQHIEGANGSPQQVKVGSSSPDGSCFGALGSSVGGVPSGQSVRLDHIERVVGDTMTLHTRSLEAVKATRSQLQNLSERVDSLEAFAFSQKIRASSPLSAYTYGGGGTSARSAGAPRPRPSSVLPDELEDATVEGGWVVGSPAHRHSLSSPLSGGGCGGGGGDGGGSNGRGLRRGETSGVSASLRDWVAELTAPEPLGVASTIRSIGGLGSGPSSVSLGSASEWRPRSPFAHRQ